MPHEVRQPERKSPRAWLFDLDNTLHDASPHIFPHINRSMRQYIERHLGLSEEDATRLRQDYWVRYGATLLGLMRHHGTDPHHFLRETHDFPDLAKLVVFSHHVRHMLRRLPGRKIIFSNAPHHYVEAILKITGMERSFDAVYAVENLRFRPKPMLEGFRSLLAAERLNPRNCIMIEDTLANLISAKRLGMRTVWVSAGSRQPAFVDLKINRIEQLAKRIGRL